jgi:hypothetical protein
MGEVAHKATEALAFGTGVDKAVRERPGLMD